MFSGIVEATAAIRERAAAGGGAVRLTIERPRALNDLAPGASVAVDGVCQTVVTCSRDRFAVTSASHDGPLTPNPLRKALSRPSAL